ncbi:DUF3347 domain-containing protein [Panacibacter sp. DH6]|uniref:DUF3347 domain-containing protein n=1 Tax=Panacibacter microcysteis TaxID=2793269 RepID=A0A931GYU1_9BACT|nr:DUF3347 domain-containing protein [Panacibacter microcysteis]MBG9377772.1 DUF3347 domain-containing protein [Panacibacter microcysteis]
MKKGLIFLGLAVAIGAVYFIFFNKDESSQPAPEKQQPLAQGSNSERFNKPFNDMLNSYFELKDALVDWDTTKASSAATQLADLAAKVPVQELKADTTIIETARSFIGSVIAEAQGVAGEQTIGEKRKSFYTLSDNLYNLLRTVKYDQQVIYYDKCPMAFNEDETAYWLANKRDIVNPYLGNKHPKYKTSMLGCGEIEDSINFVNR